jgi:hypothetical protein
MVVVDAKADTRLICDGSQVKTRDSSLESSSACWGFESATCLDSMLALYLRGGLTIETSKLVYTHSIKGNLFGDASRNPPS